MVRLFLILIGTLVVAGSESEGAQNCTLNDTVFNNLSSEQESALMRAGAVCDPASPGLITIRSSRESLYGQSCTFNISVENQSDFNFSYFHLTFTSYDSSGNVITASNLTLPSLRPNVERGDGVMFHRIPCNEVSSVTVAWGENLQRADGVWFVRDTRQISQLRLISSMSEIVWNPSFELRLSGELGRATVLSR